MSEEKMSIDERYKYLRMMQNRYKEASREEKKQLLTEMIAITGMHRKSLTRLMNGYILRKKREGQRGRKYGFEIERVIHVIARSMDYPCAERLQPNLVWMADQLERHGELVIEPQIRNQLQRVSVSTVQRCMKDMAIDRKLPRRKAEEANRWRREVPARRIAWDEKEAGHFEVDLVHHCGISASGQYVHTLQMVDVATGWSERVAVLGRSYVTIQDGFERILARLPFFVKEIHPDNGSEFLNDHIMTFWYGLSHSLQFSRSRAWQKNDNRFVEQKNDTLVRGYLGYRRLDTVQQTNLLNYLYDLMWIYSNFFQPVMRLREKISIPVENNGLRTIRRFDQASTPLDRLRAVNAVDENTQLYLENFRKQINPIRLRDMIYTLIHLLLNMPGADENHSQDVYQTVGIWKNPPSVDVLSSILEDPYFYQIVFWVYSYRKECVFR
jgi:hypothetical protein